MLQTRVYNDIDMDFLKHPKTGDVSKKSSELAVKQSIKNLIMIGRYEKPFHPEIYCGVKRYLFEPMNQVTTQLIKKSVEDVVKYFEPRATLNNVRVDSHEEQNLYNIVILYSIRNDPNPVNIQELDFFLERTR